MQLHDSSGDDSGDADNETSLAYASVHEASEAESDVTTDEGVSAEVFEDIDHKRILRSLSEARAEGTLDGDARKIEVHMDFDSMSASASYRNDADDTFEIDLRGLELDWNITFLEDLDTIAVILGAVPDAYGTADVWWRVQPAAAGQTFTFIADPRGKPSGDRKEVRLFCSPRRLEEAEIRSPIYSWEQAAARSAVEITEDVSDTTILAFEDYFGSAADGWRIRGEMHGGEFALGGWRPLDAVIDPGAPADAARGPVS